MTGGRLVAIFLCIFVVACSGERPRSASGYVEGEYVYVAAPEGGWISDVHVQRGATVKAGDALFTLDAEVQTALRDQQLAALTQAKAQLSNLQKGRREDELDALQATLKKAEAQHRLADTEFMRASELLTKQFVSQSFVDAKRAQRDAAKQDMQLAQSNLALAHKGARADEIAAARAGVTAAQSSLARVDYLLSQRRIHTKVGGRVEDVVRNKGEYVSPGGAVVQILPLESVRVRFFVPEVLRAKIKIGERVSVACDGCGKSLTARISYLSTTAEYTPPVIYSAGSREKLVWLVEAKPEKGVHLSPGQPVDVELP